MRKLFKMLSAIVSAAVIAVSVPVTAHADALQDAQQSVVFITRNMSPDEPEADGEVGWMETGSGFAIGTLNQSVEFIVTNAHVITSSDGQYNTSDLVVWFSVMANDFMIPEVYAIDHGRDLAVLRLPEKTDKRSAVPLNTDLAPNAETVYALGYPDYSNVSQDYKTMSTKDLTVTKGIISKQFRFENNQRGYEAYQHDAAISFGNSGGPLVNSNGEVIGVNTWVVSSGVAEGSNALTAKELATFLNSNGVSYSTGAAAVSDPVDNVPVEPEKKEFPTTIVVIAVAAVVVAAAVVVVIVMMSKKKKSPAPAQYNGAPAASPNGAVITGMKGIMANRTFNVNGSVTLGRNAQNCNVAYPVDAKGVSGIHCQIRQANGGYELIDCGSSNGTYLGNGQKLIPNVPVFLPNGSYFYLGSAEQLFQIKY